MTKKSLTTMFYLVEEVRSTYFYVFLKFDFFGMESLVFNGEFMIYKMIIKMMISNNHSKTFINIPIIMNHINDVKIT